MTATAEGPEIESLTRRLAETPADFLAEPRTPASRTLGPASGRASESSLPGHPERVGATGAVNVAAVVADTLRDIGGAPLAQELLVAFQPIDAKKNRNRLSAVLIGCWLLHDPWFVAHPGFADRAYQLLVNGLSELSALVQAPRLVTDPDRREELARLSLKALGLRPAGESEAQADDRLTTLSSSERQRVVRAAQGAEARARAIREEMAGKAAEEAADKATRE